MDAEPFSPSTNDAPKRPRRLWRRLSPLVCVAGVLSLLVAAPATLTASPEAPAVTVATATTKTLVASIPIAGTVVARAMVEVNPDVGNAEIVEVLVDVGDMVAAGDLLVRLDDSRLRSALLQAQADIARAQASLERSRSQIDAAQSARDSASAASDRAQELFDRGSGAQVSLDTAVSALASAEADLVAARDGLLIAQADLAAAEAQRDLAQHDLESAEVRAHAGGLITERNIDQGAIAGGAAGPMFRIVRDGVYEVEATVFEGSLASMKVGDQVALSLPGGISTQGSVRLVPPAVDAATRLGRVRIAFDEQPALRLGMSASGIVKSDAHDGLTVPATAVLTDAEGDFVQVVNDGRVSRRSVVTGLQASGLREIVSGLAEGEVVLARAGSFFRDGDQVRPVTPPGDAVASAGADR